MENTTTAEESWFYEINGERKGGISESDLVTLIKNGSIKHGTLIWKKGLANWTNVEETHLRAHLDEQAPPPLPGSKVNNTLVWVLAFAPLIGIFLEAIVAGVVYNGNEHRIQAALSNAQFWYITLILNVVLSFRDEKVLQKSGVDTSKFKGMVWLVPVYLYQRSQALGQNLAYFIVWIVCFLVMLSV